MYRVILSLFLSLSITNSLCASAYYQLLVGVLENQVAKTPGWEKLSDTALNSFITEKEDRVHEEYITSAADVGNKLIGLYEIYLGRFNEGKLPAALRTKFMVITNEDARGVVDKRTFEISEGSAGRADLKKFLVEMGASREFLRASFIKFNELSGCYGLLGGFLTASAEADGNSMPLAHSHDELARILEQTSTEAVQAQSEIVDSLIRPLFSRKFNNWETAASAVDNSNWQVPGHPTPLKAVSHFVHNGFQAPDQIDEHWGRLSLNFLIARNQALIEMAHRIKNDPSSVPQAGPEVLEIQAVAVSNRSLADLARDCAGPKNGRAGLIKQALRRRLQNKAEPAATNKPESAKPEPAVERKSEPKPQAAETVMFKVEELPVVALIDSLSDFGAEADSLPADGKAAKIIGELSEVIRYYALMKRQFISAIMGARGLLPKFEDNNDFRVILSKDSALLSLLRMRTPRPESEVATDGVLLNCTNKDLEAKLLEFFHKNGKHHTLRMRECALSSVAGMEMLMKLLPLMPDLKTCKLEEFKKIGECVNGYNACFSRFLKCYKPVLANYLYLKQRMGMASRITADYMTSDNFSVMLPGFDDISDPQAAKMLLLHSEIAIEALIMATSPAFPRYFNKLAEQRVYQLRGNKEVSSHTMPAVVIEHIERREQMLLESLRKAQEANKKNEADLKAAQGQIDLGMKEMDQANKELQKAFDAAVAESKETVRKVQSAADQRVHKIEAKARDEEQKNQQQLKAIQDLCAAHEKTLQEQRQEVETFSRMVEELKGGYAKLEAELALEQSGNSSMKAELTRAQVVYTKYKEALYSMESELTLAQQGNMSLQLSVEEHERQIVELKKQHASEKGMAYSLLSNSLETSEGIGRDLVELKKANEASLLLLSQKSQQLREAEKLLEDANWRLSAANEKFRNLEKDAEEFFEAKMAMAVRINELEAKCRESEDNKPGVLAEDAQLDLIMRDCAINQKRAEEKALKKQQAEEERSNLLAENARLMAELEAFKRAAELRPAVEPSTMDKGAVAKVVLLEAKVAKLKKANAFQEETIGNLNSMCKQLRVQQEAQVLEIRPDTSGAQESEALLIASQVKVVELQAEVSELQAKLKAYDEDPVNHIYTTWRFAGPQGEEHIHSLPAVLQITSNVIAAGYHGIPAVHMQDEISHEGHK